MLVSFILSKSTSLWDRILWMVVWTLSVVYTFMQQLFNYCSFYKLEELGFVYVKLPYFYKE
jgi:hypothetical protein